MVCIISFHTLNSNISLISLQTLMNIDLCQLNNLSLTGDWFNTFVSLPYKSIWTKTTREANSLLQCWTCSIFFKIRTSLFTTVMETVTMNKSIGTFRSYKRYFNLNSSNRYLNYGKYGDFSNPASGCVYSSFCTP